MPERVKLSLKEKFKRETRWLKEDFLELGGKIPGKYKDIAGFAVVLMAYFFFFDEQAQSRPYVTVLGSVLGAWFGVEVALLIAKALGKGGPKK
jgi:hypothetical protein